MNRVQLASCLFALTLPTLAGAESVFMTGDLGRLTTPEAPPGKLATLTDTVRLEVGAQAFAERFVAENLNAFGNETLAAVRSKTDELGSQHVRLQQHINGLRVFGAELIVHTNGRGQVYAVNGEFVRGADVATAAAIGAKEALAAGISFLGLPAKGFEGEPELLYVRDPESAEARLAWHAMVSYLDEDQALQRDHLFVDATTGEVIDRIATFHTARNRRTHTANNGSTLPGTLLCTETTTCSDAAANAAHVNAGITYNYYSAKHGRDSLNGTGLTLTSTVHYLSNYNNAGWTGTQMVYGDGDGSTFSYLSNSLDVVAHELTHGVTQYESNLTYSRESGALNEAWSDIFGAAAEIYNNGGTINSNTWKLGETIYTPSIPGDALRYMDNPTADGYSKDYYPERLYPGSCTPSNANDQCGVHGN
ncbi:MAG: peptidase M4 family protein, partial [Acidobacteria bacterium]|nr:peptidase M4 family protein [Acidobacteriota bacterium]